MRAGARNLTGVAAGSERDAAYENIVCVAATAFWDATLRQDSGALRC